MSNGGDHDRKTSYQSLCILSVREMRLGCIVWLVLSAGCTVPEPPAPDEDERSDRAAVGGVINDRHELVPPDFQPGASLALSTTETLSQYSARCDAATGVTVPDFVCEDGTLVPTTNFANGSCDRPNRLNMACDPDSRFQVLTNTPDAYVVAHCRKVGRSLGHYGDIAVIQHNKNNGATCFYQALPNLPPDELDGNVVAPSRGQGAWRWLSPSQTAVIRCVRCHDNGPIIRSPYLTQLTGLNKLPGAGDNTFNRDQPYYFVGADFGSWQAYKVEVAGSPCNVCHRMATNNQFGNVDGAALDLGLRATAGSEPSKNMHDMTSPIWMMPGQIVFDPGVASAAQNIHDCAWHRVDSPLPSSTNCRITPYTSSSLHIAKQAFGGNIFGQTFSYQTTDFCSPGFVRSTATSQWFSDAGGNCGIDGWVTGDIHDCRVAVHAQTGGFFFGGTCVTTVDEVAVPLPQNLAAGKPTSQSSTLNGGGASRAVDGKTDGDWNNGSVTHTNFELGPWWQVDLGAMTSIGEVVLYNRTDCCSTRLADFDVQLSNDGINWQTAFGFGGPAGIRTAGFLGASGRFLRVRLRGTNYLSLAEVQVFPGPPPPPLPPPVCGNGIRESSERCDDGNASNFDQCSDDCQHSCSAGRIWCDCNVPSCLTQTQCGIACDR